MSALAAQANNDRKGAALRDFDYLFRREAPPKSRRTVSLCAMPTIRRSPASIMKASPVDDPPPNCSQQILIYIKQET